MLNQLINLLFIIYQQIKLLLMKFLNKEKMILIIYLLQLFKILKKIKMILYLLINKLMFFCQTYFFKINNILSDNILYKVIL